MFGREKPSAAPKVTPSAAGHLQAQPRDGGSGAPPCWVRASANPLPWQTTRSLACQKESLRKLQIPLKLAPITLRKSALYCHSVVPRESWGRPTPPPAASLVLVARPRGTSQVFRGEGGPREPRSLLICLPGPTGRRRPRGCGCPSAPRQGPLGREGAARESGAPGEGALRLASRAPLGKIPEIPDTCLLCQNYVAPGEVCAWAGHRTSLGLGSLS